MRLLCYCYVQVIYIYTVLYVEQATVAWFNPTNAQSHYRKIELTIIVPSLVSQYYLHHGMLKYVLLLLYSRGIVAHM